MNPFSKDNQAPNKEEANKIIYQDFSNSNINMKKENFNTNNEDNKIINSLDSEKNRKHLKEIRDLIVSDVPLENSQSQSTKFLEEQALSTESDDQLIQISLSEDEESDEEQEKKKKKQSISRVKKSGENYFSEDEIDEGPALDLYGKDITFLAQEGKLEECFGREAELYEMMEILVRRQKNNPVLVGDAGVGKTAIIELFANRLVTNLVPFVLQGRSIVSIDLARIVAGSRYRGEFEARFQRVIDEALEQPHIILFIDEIHTLVGAGSAEGSLDAANILKPALSRSGFQCVGATTGKEYQAIEKDEALNRRFQPIKVKEPSIQDTVSILYGIRPSLEAFHNLEILPIALHSAAELSARYIQDRHLPDKAIDLVDRAAAKKVIQLTRVTSGSVISSLASSAIQNMGRLRLEAFRRGDIASEFVFQEIETAYRSFILTWVEQPLQIPDSTEVPKDIQTPIADSLFRFMRNSMLPKVDELLFSSPTPRKMHRKFKRFKNISASRNLKIYHNFIPSSFTAASKPKNLSLYRLATCLFQSRGDAAFQTFRGSFVKRIEKTQKRKIFVSPYLTANSTFLQPDLRFVTQTNWYKILKELNKYPWFSYLSFIREKVESKISWYSKYKDFIPKDAEKFEKKYKLLSQLEKNRTLIVRDFLYYLRPLLRKGLVESFTKNTEFALSKKERKIIYILLGYLSTDLGHDFLLNLESPELVRRARYFGNFNLLKERLTDDDIQKLLAHITGIPTQSISRGEAEKLKNLEAILHQRVIGQHEAVTAISKAIRRSRVGIQNPSRPIASFFFCGPTGVGKTEVTKALAATMFGSENDMIRLDMSEFMEKFTVSRLVGSPPGYVGYEDGGQLTDAVRRKPYSVVLFDEIEKAHPDVLNLLLQILEDGRLTDSHKRLIPFENTVIIMTSNAGADSIQAMMKDRNENKIEEEKEETEEKTNASNSLKLNASKLLAFYPSKKPENETFSYMEDEYSGPIRFLKSPIVENHFADVSSQLEGYIKFSLRKVENKKKLSAKSISSLKFATTIADREEFLGNLKNVVLERLSKLFLPEFLNRLDDIIIFQPLTREDLKEICDIMINNVADRIIKKEIRLFISTALKNKLLQEGYNPAFGARPLRRLVTKYIEDKISDFVLNNPDIKPVALTIDLDQKNEIVYTYRKLEPEEAARMDAERDFRNKKKKGLNSFTSNTLSVNQGSNVIEKTETSGERQVKKPKPTQIITA